MKNLALKNNDTMNEFTLEEAVSMIYRHAVLKKNAVNKHRKVYGRWIPQENKK